MNKPNVNRKRILLRILLLILLIFIGILAYFQFFYQSPRVDTGVARLATVFRGHRQIVTSVRFMPGDSLLITGSVDSTIQIWQKHSGKVVKSIRHPQGVAYLDLSTDGRYIVTGSYDSKVRVWNTQTGEQVKELNGHTGTVWTVAFSADGSKIASGGDDGVINVWDVATGHRLQQLKGHQRIVWSVKFSPDGSQIASGSFDYTVKLWDVVNGKLLWDNTAHEETVVDIAFSYNGKLLATASDDKTIKLWNVAQRQLVRTMKVAEHVQGVAFSPDDKRLLTGGRDKPMMGELLQNFLGDSEMNKGVSARLWEIETGKLLQTFSSHANDVMDLAYSYDGTTIATASADKTVEIWRLLK